MPVELVVLAALAGIVAGVVLTALAVTRLVRVARQPELARAAIVPATPIAFAESGRAELAIEGPRFTTQLRGLDFELVDGTGTPVPMARLWVRSSSGGLGRARLSLYRTDIPQPGTYELRVAGIDPDADYGRCAVVFVRPYGPEFAATIVGLIASVGLTAASFATAGALLFRSPPTDTVTVPIDPPAPAERTFEARGGRQIPSDSALLRTARDVVWPVLRMRLRVPDDWTVRKLTATELDLRHPTEASTFLVARAQPMPAGPTFDEYVEADVTHAREQLATHTIDGYATKRFDAVQGVLTLEHRDDGGGLITWTGFQPAVIGSLSVTVLAGASGIDFERQGPLLGAIVESIRFE